MEHLEQTQTLAIVHLDRKTQEAWPATGCSRSSPGWSSSSRGCTSGASGEHPGYPGSPVDFFTDFINAELSQLSSDRSALAVLRGVPELLRLSRAKAVK